MAFLLSRPWIVSDSTVHCSTFPALSAKTTTLTIRSEPGLKEALREAANHEHRSIANMVEMLIMDYCDKNGIAIDKPARAGQVKNEYLEHQAGRS
jgi:hypothetical protein